MAKRKKKETEMPRPLLARHCKRCGEWFIATHPKDPQEYCERCRNERESDRSKGTDRQGI